MPRTPEAMLDVAAEVPNEMINKDIAASLLTVLVLEGTYHYVTLRNEQAAALGIESSDLMTAIAEREETGRVDIGDIYLKPAAGCCPLTPYEDGLLSGLKQDRPAIDRQGQRLGRGALQLVAAA